MKMQFIKSNYKKIREKYLKFLKSQEVLTEPFRNKMSQLDNFFLPISHSIYKIFKNRNRTIIVGLTEDKVQASQLFQVY